MLKGRDGKIRGDAIAESREMFRTMGRREMLKYVVDGSAVSVSVSVSPPQVLRYTMHRRA